MPDERSPEARRLLVTTTPVPEDLLDLEFEALCALEADEGVTLDEVWEATSSIPGSMARALIEDERAERF